MENINEFLLSQLKESNEVIKISLEAITKLTDSYITKDKEKDKKQMFMLISVIGMSLLTILVIIWRCRFING